MIAIALRLLAGVFQVLDEIDRGWTWSSLLGRMVSPVGASAGLLSIALALLLVLSPTGSISMRSNKVAIVLTVIVAVIAAVGVLNEIVFSGGTWQQRLGQVSREPSIAALLAGTAAFLLKNHDPDR